LVNLFENGNFLSAAILVAADYGFTMVKVAPDYGLTMVLSALRDSRQFVECLCVWDGQKLQFLSRAQTD
jgi:hypothetical protein